MGDVSVAAVSTAVAFVVAVLVAATSVAIFAITDFLMMSSSATSAFRGGGAGAIRTDITVTTRTITMGTATMGTAGTVTTVAPVMDIAMAADQGVCGGGDKRAPRRLGFGLLLVRPFRRRERASIRTWRRKIPPMRSGSEEGRQQFLI